MYDHRGILEDGCETKTEVQANYFVTNDGVTDAFLILDLGCDIFVTNVHLKNTYNYGGYE